MNFLAGVTFKSYESNGAFHLSELALPDHCRRNENFTFNQNYPARYVKS